MARSTTIGVVVNPAAGNGRGRRAGRPVIDQLRAAGAEVLDLSGASYAQARAHARAAQPDLRALVVVGGDGMVHLGLDAVAGTDTPMGIVPVGSGNDFAVAAGLDPHRRIDVDRMLAGIDDPTPVDALRLHWSDGRPTWVGGAVSVGIDAAVNVRANSYRWPRTSLKYVRAMIAEVAQARSYGYRVVMDDDIVWEHAGVLAFAANIPHIGGGIRVAPLAEFTDGLIDVVVARSLSRLQILAILPKLYRGRHLDHPAVEHFRARRVRIEVSAGLPAGEVAHRLGVPPAIHGDGELLGDLPVTIEVVPGAARLLLP